MVGNGQPRRPLIFVATCRCSDLTVVLRARSGSCCRVKGTKQIGSNTYVAMNERRVCCFQSWFQIEGYSLYLDLETARVETWIWDAAHASGGSKSRVSFEL